jgi:hypothetical protein
MDQEEADRIAADWVAAWNAHDLERILAHYADTLEFTSPLVVERLGRADGTIRDKAALRAYFAVGVAPGSTLRFELIDALPGVASLILYYRNHRGRTVAETMHFGPDGKVVRATVHYH